MNIKLSEMLFEENNPEKLNKIFEENNPEEAASTSEEELSDGPEGFRKALKAQNLSVIKTYFRKSQKPSAKSKGDPKDKMVMNFKEVEILSSRITPKLKTKMPKEKDIVDIKDNNPLKTVAAFLKQKLENFVIDNYEVEVFKPTNQLTSSIDMIYAKLGFVVFELAKKDVEVKGKAQDGKDINMFFIVPFPGFKTSNRELVEFHKEVFNLDFSKVDKEEVKDKDVEIMHVGIGNQIKPFPVSENLENIHKNTLSSLLFEKKSIDTRDKQQLVESYFNVNYKELNNFKKRDFFNLSKVLYSLEGNILLEKTAADIDYSQAAMEKLAAQEKALGVDAEGNPNITSEKGKTSLLNKLKAGISKAKAGAKEKLQALSDKISSLKVKGSDSETVSTSNISGQNSDTVLLVGDESSKEDSSTEDATSEEESEEESEEASEKDDKFQRSGTLKKRLAELGSDSKALSKYCLNTNELNKKLLEAIDSLKKLGQGLNKEITASKFKLVLAAADKQAGITEEDKAAAKKQADVFLNLKKGYSTTAPKIIKLLQQAANTDYSKIFKVKLGKDGVEDEEVSAELQAQLLARTVTKNMVMYDIAVATVSSTVEALGPKFASLAELHAKQIDKVDRGKEVSQSALLASACGSLDLSEEDAKIILGQQNTDVNDSYNINKNLLNINNPKNALLFEADKSLSKIHGKIVKDANGNIDPSALKFFYDQLEGNSAYKKIQSKFINRFESWSKKSIKKGTKDEIASLIPQFFNELSMGNIKSDGSPGKSTDWGAIAKKTFKGIGISIAAATIFGAGYYAFRAIQAAAALKVGLGVLIAKLSAPGAAYQMMQDSNLELPMLDNMNPEDLSDPGTMAAFVEQVEAGLASSKIDAAVIENELGIKVEDLDFIDHITEKISGMGSAISDTGVAVKETLAPGWDWLAAPYTNWAGFANFSTAFPTLTGVFWCASGAGAIIVGTIPLLVSMGLGALGFTAAAASAEFWALKLITWGMGKMSLGTKLAMGGGLTGPVAIVLASGLLFLYLKRKKRKKKELQNTAGEVFKLYVISAATGESIDTITKLLGKDYTKYEIAFVKEIVTTEDEIKLIAKRLSSYKQKKGSELFKTRNISITSIADLEEYVNEYESFLGEANNKKDLKQATINKLEEVLVSFKNDVAAAKLGLDFDVLEEHYKQHSFLKIIDSKLKNKRDHFAYTDVDTISLIDSKEALVKSIQERRNNELSSLKAFGDFTKISGDPISELVKQIVATKKGQKLSANLDLAKIVKDFEEGNKFTEDVINYDELFNKLSASHANITANDIRKYYSSGFFDSKRLPQFRKFFKTKKSVAESYVKEFINQISKNLEDGLERLVDTSVLSEGTFRNNSTNNLLLEYGLEKAKQRIISQSVGQNGLLTEASITSVTSNIFKAALGANLVNYGLTSLGYAGFAGVKVLGAITIGAILKPILAGAALLSMVGIIYKMYMDKFYEGNFDPYKDKNFKAALKDVIFAVIRRRVAMSYAQTILYHKPQLEKIGIKITGEDNPIFSEYKKEIDSRTQVKQLKKNLNDPGKKFYTAIRDIVYYTRNQNTVENRRGLGHCLNDTMLNAYIDNVCFKPSSPFEEIFKVLQEKKNEEQDLQAGVNEEYIYKQGIGLLLVEASGNTSVKVSINEVYKKFSDQTYDFLYKQVDFNGVINNKIIEIIEPLTKWSGSNAIHQVRNFNPFSKKDKRNEFMIDTLSDAAYRVTNIEKGRLVKILNNSKARTEEEQTTKIKTKLRPESFVHRDGLGLLIEDTQYQESLKQVDISNIVKIINNGQIKNASTKDVILRAYTSETSGLSTVIYNSNSQGGTWSYLKFDNSNNVVRFGRFDGETSEDALYQLIGDAQAVQPDTSEFKDIALTSKYLGGDNAQRVFDVKNFEVDMSSAPLQPGSKAITHDFDGTLTFHDPRGGQLEISTDGLKLPENIPSNGGEAMSGQVSPEVKQIINDKIVLFTTDDKKLQMAYDLGDGKYIAIPGHDAIDMTGKEYNFSGQLEGWNPRAMSDDEIVAYEAIIDNDMSVGVDEEGGVTSADPDASIFDDDDVAEQDTEDLLDQDMEDYDVDNSPVSLDPDDIEIKDADLEGDDADLDPDVDDQPLPDDPDFDPGSKAFSGEEAEGLPDMGETRLPPVDDMPPNEFWAQSIEDQTFDDTFDSFATENPEFMQKIYDRGVFDDQESVKQAIYDTYIDGSDVDADAGGLGREIFDQMTTAQPPIKGALNDIPEFTYWDNLKEVDWNSIRGDLIWARLGVGALAALAASPIEQRTVVPLVRSIDWARIIAASLTNGLTSFLVRNKQKLNELSIEVVGQLPPEIKQDQQAVSEDFGSDPEMSGVMSILSKESAKRLKGSTKKDIDQKTIEKYLRDEMENVVIGFHRSFDTELYQKAAMIANQDLAVGGRKKARSNVNRKTAVALTGMTVAGYVLTATGLGAMVGIPLLATSGHLYSNRAAAYEDDQLITGSENEAEFQSQLKKLTKDETKKLVQVIVDIAKEAKGVQESFVKRDLPLIYEIALSSLLFEDTDLDMRKTDSVGFQVDKVVSALKSKGILCYGAGLKPGSEDFNNAESYIVDLVCSILETTCDVKIKGREKFNKPQNIRALAKGTVDTSAKVGEPASQRVAAQTAGSGVPAMNQPIRPQQYMGLMNQGGGGAMEAVCMMMAFNMMKTSGGTTNEFQDFIKQMNGGKITTAQSIEKTADMIEKATEATSPKSKKSDDSSASDSATKTFSREEFIQAYEETHKTIKAGLPFIDIDDVRLLNKKLIANLRNLKDSRSKGYIDIKNTSTKEFSSILTNYFNISKDDEDKKYSNMKHDTQDAIQYAITDLIKSNMITLNTENLNKFSDDTIKIDLLKDIILYSSSQFVHNRIASILGNKSYSPITRKTKIMSRTIMTQNGDDKLKKMKISKVFDAVSGHEFDDKEKKIVEDMLNIFNFSIVADGRILRNKNILKEEVIMGRLSNLLFESPIEAGPSLSRKTVDKKVNLREEWLKIWDI